MADRSLALFGSLLLLLLEAMVAEGVKQEMLATSE